MKNRIEIDRMWRTPAERREFEQDTGLAALADGGWEYADQVASGHTEDYQTIFIGWAARKLSEPQKNNEMQSPDW